MYELKHAGATFTLQLKNGGQWIGLELVSPLENRPISVLSGHKENDPFFASGSFLMFPWVNRLDPNPWAREPFFPSTQWLTDGNGLSLHGLYHSLPRTILSETGDTNSRSLSLGFEIPEEWKGTALGKQVVVETYHLNQHALGIEYSIRNDSDSEFLFSLGIHPYFSFGQDSTVDDLYLFGSGFQEVKLGDYLIPERIVPEPIRFVGETKLEGKNFDHLYKSVNPPQDEVYFGFFSVNRRERVLVIGGKYYQIYIPPDRKSIAIEPMTATGNFLHFERDAIIAIQPGEEKKITFLIRIETF
ncbi:aldose 1-epimerase domain protein [Leptospira ryugenii]|uniref:Aldose 1-epimerase domain protein n=1 Tax=Leptospira ryugenii TaxID=1917863 RepID=A0A2P2DYW4_9LEPT|nr:aldose 1-epimerase [Leptospira ryugenii]GBF49815.1 aldose 1-epimerase domain protein [Leptospira ryugenii]